MKGDNTIKEKLLFQDKDSVMCQETFLKTAQKLEVGTSILFYQTR
jgi:hypothetical protein